MEAAELRRAVGEGREGGEGALRAGEPWGRVGSTEAKRSVWEEEWEEGRAGGREKCGEGRGSGGRPFVDEAEP